MDDRRPGLDAYLRAAEALPELITSRPIASAWASASALPGMTVGALVAHMAQQVAHADLVLDRPPDPGPVRTLEAHYASAVWIGAELDAPVNRSVRETAGAAAEAGSLAIAEDVAARLVRQRAVLPAVPGDLCIGLPWTGWSLRADDLLLTRALELVVHEDDLARSDGGVAVEVDREASDAVISLLARLAARRHGTAPVLRALARPDVAKGPIDAI